MSTARVLNNDNIIQFTLINGEASKKEKIRYNKDGSVDKRHTNKVAGVSSEVYAFTKNEEIESMIKIFNENIDRAINEEIRQIACRNKMLFLIVLNVGLRASDLTTLKWSFFLKDNGDWKDFYKLQPQKTRNKNKFVTIYINKTVKKAITDYIEEYPINNMDDYMFKTRLDNKPITVPSLWRIIKETAKEAGIDNKNIGSHSLRKSFGYWCWHNAEDKNKALVVLQSIFNHSSTTTTMKYIGLTNDDMSDMFGTVELGLDFI